MLLHAAEPRIMSHAPAPLTLARPLHIHARRSSSQVQIEHAIVERIIARRDRLARVFVLVALLERRFRLDVGVGEVGRIVRG